MITADQIVAHLVGDYLLQSDYMAQKKTSSSFAATLHAFTYTIPFLALTRTPEVLLFIAGSHFIIDRWRLARYVVWLKNFFAPRSAWPPPWRECTATGYGPDRPPWLAVWLLIIADNTLHLLCNGLAFRLWPILP